MKPQHVDIAEDENLNSRLHCRASLALWQPAIGGGMTHSTPISIAVLSFAKDVKLPSLDSKQG
jgi:hypothetical protein